MKRIILLILIVAGYIHAWETTTHRAIDKTAIESQSAVNLKQFVKNAGIEEENYYSEIFESYTNKKTGQPITYFEYFNTKYSSDAMADWNQTFDLKISSYQNLIEAGTMLEDAVWPGAWFGGDGRFNNHFYDPQNGGKGLTWGYGRRTDAVSWAKNGWRNSYSFDLAQRWFKNGFTLATQSERRKYQAKMLVSVGHLMHLVNDMNVPAHVRDDSHPLGDPLEVWMRGGWDGSDASQGFHVMGSSVTGFQADGGAPQTHPALEAFMQAEAIFTSRNFFSKDTLYEDDYYPNESTISYTDYVDMGNNVKKHYIKNSNGTKIAIEISSKFCNDLRKIYYDDNPSRRGRGLCGAPTSIQGDDSVLEESGKALIPRAIANAAGFLNYFFRGQIEAEVSACGVKVSNVSNPSLVASPDTVIFRKGGVIGVYYNDNEGKRTMIGSIKLSKDLAAGKSIQIPMQITKEIYDTMPDNDKKLTIVYDGNIGAERGVSVCRVNLDEEETVEVPKAFDGAIDMYLSWNYACDIDMDLTMEGPNVNYDLQDIKGYGKEHAYVPTLYDVRPGDHYDFSANGEQTEESFLDEEDLEDDPISIYALLETPTGSYFKQWEVKNFANLDIGKFAELDVKEKIMPKWICPAINNVPNYYNLYNQDTGKFDCLYCPQPYSVVWSKPNAKLPGYWRCNRPIYYGGGGDGGGRSYNQCSENEKKDTCGCVPCEFIVSGMKKRVENGPIAGADVTIIRADEADESNPHVVFTTKTTDKEDIFESGMIELSDEAKGRIDVDAYYLVSASGGYDIDYDDDMHRDIEPTKNNGTIHAIIKGEDLILMPFKVNILTEAIYQVSGDATGSNYDKEALEQKLDDASRRLITQKLYIKDDNNTIRYADILLWTPAVDKKTLYKPFEIFVEPIIEKLYADKERYQESYSLIYDPYDSDAPQLKPLALTIPQGLPNGTVVAKVTALNQKPFNDVVIEGSYHDHFSANENGSIAVAQSEEIKEGNNYHLQMYAVGEDNKTGAKVSLNIEVNGTYAVAHLDKSVPMFVSADVYPVEENSPEGTPVADIVFSDSNATITEYHMSGEDAEHFAIDTNGHISVAQGARIDYEKNRMLHFDISASNDAGNESYPVRIEVPVVNVIDTPIFDQVVFEHIEENTPVGTVVTQIRQDREGLGEIEKFEILSPHIPFGIDNNGTLYVKELIDYEQEKSYNFYAIAVTPYGNSNKIEINIVVDDQEPEVGIPRIQENIRFEVPEDIQSGAVVGNIQIDKGAEPIEKIAWFGMGKEYFRIDENGTIYLAEGFRLNYELTPHYDLGIRALNARGWSNEVHISIDVKDVADTPPTLQPARYHIEENVPVGTVVGMVQVLTQGEGNIIGFEIYGDGAEDFIIDRNGTVKTAQSIDYERRSEYRFFVDANSTAGVSDAVTMSISVVNIPEMPPVLANMDFSILESMEIGSDVGSVIVVDSGDTPIEHYEINGTVLFGIDNNGTITLSAEINRSQVQDVNFSVMATNAFGASEPATINIEVLQVYYRGTGSADTMNGSDRDEYFDAKSGDDVIFAGGGNDRLIGGIGNDYLNGGSGDDVYIYHRGDGNDTIEDDSGDDRLYLYGIDKNKTGYILDDHDLVLKFDDNATIHISNWVDNNYKIEHFIYEDGEVTSDMFDKPIVKPDASIADLSKLGNNNAAQVVQGWIVPLGNGNLKVDHWIFNFEGGELIIDTLSELNSNGQAYIDIDGDGEQLGIDLWVYLYKKNSDGSWQHIANDDDSSQTYDDGSTHRYDSYLKLTLDAGEYLLAIGNFSLSSSAALNGENNAGGYGRGGAYQITFNHELDFVEIPTNANGDLYGSDHFNYYVLRNDIDPYNGSGLHIENPEIVDGNGSIIDTKGHTESYGTFISFYPDDAFIDLNGSEEVNIVYDVINQNQSRCKSLLSIQVIPSLYERQNPEVNSVLWEVIKTENECDLDLNITKSE